MGHVSAGVGRGDGAGGWQAASTVDATISAWQRWVSGVSDVGGIGDVGCDEAVGHDGARQGGT